MRGIQIGSSIRKFFINTLFDSTFTLLGVVSGSAFITNPDIRTIMITLVSSSIALGISSGVSIYEAEIIEGKREVEELENAMLVNLDNTYHSESIKINAILASLINFATPLCSMIIAITPFILANRGLLRVRVAGSLSILLCLGTLTAVGAYMGKDTDGSAILKGLRMAFFGTVAFLIGYLLESII
jgi:predicted membrane protein (TIGR00267 family)